MYIKSGFIGKVCLQGTLKESWVDHHSTFLDWHYVLNKPADGESSGEERRVTFHPLKIR